MGAATGGNGYQPRQLYCADGKVCGRAGADADDCERVYQEDRRISPGQVQRQAQAEDKDLLQLSGRG